jgi:hypothetical protein
MTLNKVMWTNLFPQSPLAFEIERHCNISDACLEKCCHCPLWRGCIDCMMERKGQKELEAGLELGPNGPSSV